MSDEERVSPVEVVAGFIASEVGHWSPGMAEQARELIGALEAAGWQIVAGEAVVIPRSAIPDGLIERLETRRGAHRSTQDKIDQIAAARLLSGGSPAAPEPERPPATPEDKVVDLMAALEASIDAARSDRRDRAKRRRGMSTLHRWTDGDGTEWACAAYDHGPFCRLCNVVDEVLAGILANVDKGYMTVEGHDPKTGELRFAMTEAGNRAAAQLIEELSPEDGTS